MSPRLEVLNLNKSFSKKKVLTDLQFSINDGECLCLLGSNGAGKSTCISILLNFLKFDSGEIKINSLAHSHNSAKSERSCLPQESQFIEGLKAKEVLKYVQSLYPNPLDLESVIADFQLRPLLNIPCQFLSGGQRRLLGLAIAFIGNSKLVLLDEPTTGLDAELRNLVWKHINNFKIAGGAILLTTHNLEEAEILSDRIAFLDQGKIIKVGSLQELKLQTKQKNIRFSLKNIKLQKKAHWVDFNQKGSECSITTNTPEEDLKEILNSYPIQHLVVEDIKLEQIMQSLRESQ